MNRNIRLQLSFMMFLEFFIWGCWFVTMGNYLPTVLNATGLQIGAAYATNAIGAIIAPFFVGMFADKYFAAQKILGVLHLFGGALLYLCGKSADFEGFYWLILLYNLMYMPTLALVNSISFRQMNNPASEFPSIRVLGTIGWIAAGWALTFLGADTNSKMFLIGAAASVALGVYAFTLPDTPPLSKGKSSTWKDIVGLDAFSLFKDSHFVVFFIASFLICIPLSFYYNLTNNYFTQMAMTNPTFKMTFGQVSEILFMLAMPWFFRRLGVKWMILAGMAAWLLRYTAFRLGYDGPQMWLFYIGIILHGVCFDFFFVTGQIYTDHKAGPKIQSAAQGLITLATYGLGMFTGSYIQGLVSNKYTLASANGLITFDWKVIWLVPLLISAFVIVFFYFFFKDKSQPHFKA